MWRRHSTRELFADRERVRDTKAVADGRLLAVTDSWRVELELWIPAGSVDQFGNALKEDARWPVEAIQSAIREGLLSPRGPNRLYVYRRADGTCELGAEGEFMEVLGG